MSDIGEVPGYPVSDEPQRPAQTTLEHAEEFTNTSVTADNCEAKANCGATATSDEAYVKKMKELRKRATERKEQFKRHVQDKYWKDDSHLIPLVEQDPANFENLKREFNREFYDNNSKVSSASLADYLKADELDYATRGGNMFQAVGSGFTDMTTFGYDTNLRANEMLFSSPPQVSPEDAKNAIDLQKQALEKKYPGSTFVGQAGPFGKILAAFKRKKSKGNKSKDNPPPKNDSPPKNPPRDLKAEGDPVSVANGEYLETWTDFLIPGTYAFDGARYMGLKLALPSGYTSPLGPCQISMFDEVFSNPEPGSLTFHSADGKEIDFDRPFNFLPSINEGYPHLQLKAPWLKQLQLKDRTVTKHFKQYADGIYRLEKITELNGYELIFTRTSDGILTRVDGPDGLSLLFQNDAQGRRTVITLVENSGERLNLSQYAYDAQGRMTSAQCAFGMSVDYVWQSSNDLLESWNNISRASETHFTYDDDGRVLHTKTNGIWNDDRFDYREKETAYLPGGNEQSAQRFQYDDNENITAEINALGHELTHTYNANGFKTATRDANGHATSTRYDIDGNIKEFKDAEGRSTIYGWGYNGELDIVIDGAGNRKTYDHDDKANVISETDSEGNTTKLVRDDKGRVITTEFPNGAVERRTWDDRNRLTSVTDAKGNTTRFAYDVFNRLTATKDALGNVTTQHYEAGAGGFDAPTTITRPDKVSVNRTFDANGRLATVRDGEGRVWTYKHGAFDVLQEIEDPKGGVLKFDYDIEGQIISVTNAMGRAYRFNRDCAGQVVEEIDFDGRVKKYTRDAAGQVVETIKPDGARLTYTYDKSGLLTGIDTFVADGTAKGKAEDQTRLEYDGRGLLIRAENRAGFVEFERDKNGLITDEDINGHRIRSRYDVLSNRIRREFVGGGLTETIRDPLGAVEELVIDGKALTFSRDALGRETRRQSEAGFKQDQGFDAASQLISQNAGQAIKGVGGMRAARDASVHKQAGRVYEYDRAFSPVKISDILGGDTSFAYDPNGQVTKAVNETTGDTSAGVPGSGAQRPTAANLEERFDYDAARNLAGASASAPDASVGAGLTNLTRFQSTPGGVTQIARGPRGENISLDHDECGRVIKRRVHRDGFRPQVWHYAWDVHDRLVGCTDPDGVRWVYAYDPFGRRLSKQRRFGEQELIYVRARWPELVADQPDLPERGSHYLREIAPGGHQPGDKIPPVTGTFYMWDGDQMVQEAPLRLDGTIDETSATLWHYEESDHTPLAKQLPDGTLHYIVTDHLGTPKEMFDETGDLVWSATHHVWGAVRAVKMYGGGAGAATAWSDGGSINGGGTNGAAPAWQGKQGASLVPARERAQAEGAARELICPFRFPGQYEDVETGLNYNRHRYYDALTGQYCSPDPISLAGGDRPQGYVDRPGSWVDPLGLKASPTAQAKNWQGKDAYPGTDNWKGTTLKKGDVVYGGLPGQGNYYTNAATVTKSGMEKKPIWEMLQVQPHPKFGPRTSVQAYQVQKNIPAAEAKTLANPQFGAGGGQQFFIPNNSIPVLKPIGPLIPVN